MEHNQSRTMTASMKLTASEKIRYTQIAKSHYISFSEWAASILNMYQNAYGELKINSLREDELLNEIDRLRKKNNLLEAYNKLLATRLDIAESRLRF